MTISTESLVSGKPARPRRGPILAALYVVSLLSALNLTIVAASLATIVGDLDGLEQMAWAIVSYTLAATVSLPVWGQLGDTRGRRKMFFAALVVFIVGSVLCGLSATMFHLTAARVVQGVGGAGIGVLAQTILADVVPARQRAKYMSYLGSVFAVATVAGPLIGGVLTDTVGWRWIFFLNVPLGGVALAVAVITTPRTDPVRPDARLDLRGAVLLTTALSLLVVAFSLAENTVSWTSPLRGGMVGGAVLVALIFFAVERRAEVPILPLVMFHDRVVVGAILLSTVVGVGLFSIVAYLPAFVQMRYATSATVAGVVPIAIVAGILLSSNLIGVVVSRTGRYRRYPLVGTALAATALVVLSSAVSVVGLPVMAALFLLVGLGVGAFMQLTVVLAQSRAPRPFVGVATATINLVRQVGATLATAVIGGAFAASLVQLLRPVRLPAGVSVDSLTPEILWSASGRVREQVAQAYAQAFQPILFGLAVVFVVGFVVALITPVVELEDSQTTP